MSILGSHRGSDSRCVLLSEYDAWMTKMGEICRVGEVGKVGEKGRSTAGVAKKHVQVWSMSMMLMGSHRRYTR